MKKEEWCGEDSCGRLVGLDEVREGGWWGYAVVGGREEKTKHKNIVEYRFLFSANKIQREREEIAYKEKIIHYLISRKPNTLS